MNLCDTNDRCVFDSRCPFVNDCLGWDMEEDDWDYDEDFSE